MHVVFSKDLLYIIENFGQVGDSPQCGEMSRSDRGDGRPLGDVRCGRSPPLSEQLMINKSGLLYSRPVIFLLSGSVIVLIGFIFI